MRFDFEREIEKRKIENSMAIKKQYRKQYSLYAYVDWRKRGRFRCKDVHMRTVAE